MSPRETLQTELAAWLGSWTTAPYGVLTSLRIAPSGKGKARVVAFGVKKQFDAALIIWSPDRLELMSTRYRGRTLQFKSASEFKAYCAAELGAPE